MLLAGYQPFDSGHRNAETESQARKRILATRIEYRDLDHDGKRAHEQSDVQSYRSFAPF